MVDKSQCQTHTRTPWGKSAHLYDRRIRYLFMGILFVTFLAAKKPEPDLSNLVSTDFWVSKVVHGDKEKHPYHPPFQLCGNHLHDCQAYFKPNFCCPPLQVCHETKWSPSGIYCCAMTDECIVSEEHPATCLANTTQCGRELGGGCCPEGTTCSPDGCLQQLESGTGLLDSLLLPRMEMDEEAVSETFGIRQDKAESHKALSTGFKFGEVGMVKLSTSEMLRIPRMDMILSVGMALSFVSL
ncbi:hypothetical protein CEP54_004975 [Fusarium duplospermum]|uniref:Uncharacterized protein n=1 Tax=Fusarium duplospermum TaxID=1325734 RepID=A0A428QFC0_9HYPO|nr:hypothetical protein CEP54_004975 [Fusarium duplospermum]